MHVLMQFLPYYFHEDLPSVFCSSAIPFPSITAFMSEVNSLTLYANEVLKATL